MRLSDETRKHHENMVREILVRKPDATIQVVMEDLARGVRIGNRRERLLLSNNYVNRIMRKIRARRNNYFPKHLSAVLAEMEEHKLESAKVLWEIVTDPSVWAKDKIAALKELRETNEKFLEAMFNAGIYEKELGNLRVKDERADVVDLLKLGRELRDEMAQKQVQAQNAEFTDGGSKPADNPATGEDTPGV
jgi:DNA-binding MarR family transcriptional regulator